MSAFVQEASVSGAEFIVDTRIGNPDTLRVFVGANASESVRNVIGIARCLGISAELIELGCFEVPLEELKTQLSASSRPCVVDVESVSRLSSVEGLESLGSTFAGFVAPVLLLVTSAERFVSGFLEMFTRGEVREVRYAGNPGSVTFPAAGRLFSAELSGHTFQRSARGTVSMAAVGGSESEILAEFGSDDASFVRSQHGAAEVFVWSTMTVFDMERLLEKECEFETGIDEFVPAIIFLRRVFGSRCWHVPTMRAEIVIDDPLLVPKYGFVDFPTLLEDASGRGFHVTVAFIPWNHWRTSQRMVDSFWKYGAQFSICAHGCDHSRDEFLAADDADLLERSHLAAERMDRQRDRTGLVWERLMVCPREDYSLSGLRAICESGRFLGLANSGCIPRRLGTPQIKGVDLLLPAQDAFFGFPVFKRHYWTSIAAFGLSTFLGKPAILAEHHAICRDDRRALNDFVSGIEAKCPRLRWASLEEIATRSCQQRRVSASKMEVRFFADEFVFENPESIAWTVRFMKRIPACIAVEAVVLNGVPVEFIRDGDFVVFVSIIDAGASVSVVIRRVNPPRPRKANRGWFYNAGVGIRRYASELRDRYLSRNFALLWIGNGIMKVLKMRR